MTQSTRLPPLCLCVLLCCARVSRPSACRARRVARDRANATRLLKHPFVTKAQIPQPLPFPGSSPGNAASNGSPAGQRGAMAQGRGGNGSSGTPQQQQQRQQQPEAVRRVGSSAGGQQQG